MDFNFFRLFFFFFPILLNNIMSSYKHCVHIRYIVVVLAPHMLVYIFCFHSVSILSISYALTLSGWLSVFAISYFSVFRLPFFLLKYSQTLCSLSCGSYSLISRIFKTKYTIIHKHIEVMLLRALKNMFLRI